MPLVVSQPPQKNLQIHAGQWVALAGDEIVDSARSMDLLITKLKKRHLLGKVSIMLVPREDEGPYILVVV